MIDKRLLKEMPGAKIMIWKHVFMQWCSLVCNIIIIMVLADIFVELFEERLMMNQLFIASIIILMVLGVKLLCVKQISVYAFKASRDVKNHLRTRLYKKLLEMKNSYQTYIPTSELVQLNVEGIDQLETYFGRYLPQFFYSMLAPITLFVVLIWLDVKSSVILLICVPLIPLSIVAIQTFAKKLLSKYWSQYATLGDSFLENLQGLTTLKIYQADEYKNKKMNEEAEKFRNITMKVLTMQLNSVSVMDIIAYGGALIGSIIAIVGYMNGSVSLFAVICIVLLSSEFFIPLRLLGSFFHITMNGIAASGKIFKILDIPIVEDGKQHFDETPIDIQIRNLSFSYEPSREVLHDISLEIKPKQFIGIVGESGSGKSTIGKVLTGFTTTYGGSVLLQQKERSHICDDSFYERVIYITHKPTILKGTVKENLCMAKNNATDEECWDALEKTCLKEFIANQGGLEMNVLEDGRNLSGGQKQRLSIARALLADKECYIFDEATSNIDVESEDAILQVILQLVHKKTVIMISHRLHNIEKSDCIYVLSNGTCVERGTHSQLMKEKQTYNKMYTKQINLETFKGGDVDA